MNLNFDGGTKLKEWWKIVKSNFQELVNKDTEISNKVDTEIQKVKTTYASSTQYGLVKIPAKSGIVSYSGELIINTNSKYGTARTGDGKIIVSAATEAEIDDGDSEYKPIVPKTLKYGVESSLKSIFNKVQYSVDLDDLYDSGLYSVFAPNEATAKQCHYPDSVTEGMLLSARTYNGSVQLLITLGLTDGFGEIMTYQKMYFRSMVKGAGGVFSEELPWRRADVPAAEE